MKREAKDLGLIDLTNRGWEIICELKTVSGGRLIQYHITIKIPVYKEISFTTHILPQSVSELFDLCKDKTGQMLSWYI